MKPKVLVVDDEKLLRWSLCRKLEEWGYEPSEAAGCEEALRRLHDDPPDVVFLDIRLPDGDGVELLRRFRADHFAGPAIMITADPKVEDVKTALRLGAYDYLCKPINFDELHITVTNALETSRLRQEVVTLRDQVQGHLERLEIVGPSPVMRKLMDFVHRVSDSEASALLLQGESGTGKDLIAQIVHQNSSRRDRPYVPVNCSAIPEMLLEAELFGHEKGAFTDAKAMKKGLFEVADGGTIFLDEIGEMSLTLQSKLLRTLEDQSLRRIGGLRDIHVDVRVIAASNRNLEQAVRTGHFRQDLFYRLMVIPIFIPPLRSRREDIPALAAFFVEHYNRRFRKRIIGLTPEAEQMMLNYSWPGNVRELKNAIQRAMILEEGPRIRPTYLPFYSESALLTPATAFPEKEVDVAAGAHAAWHALGNGRMIPELQIPSAGTSLEEIERHLVRQALEQTQGNQSRAARLLDISRDTIRYKMKIYGLDGANKSE